MKQEAAGSERGFQQNEGFDELETFLVFKILENLRKIKEELNKQRCSWFRDSILLRRPQTNLKIQSNLNQNPNQHVGAMNELIPTCMWKYKGPRIVKALILPDVKIYYKVTVVIETV